MASKTLTATLLDGLSVKSRSDGSVHTIKDGDGHVIAELCVGVKKTRLNLRSAPKSLPKGLALDGKSKTWAGGGVIVTEENVARVRALLASVAAPAAAKPASKRTRSTAKAA